MTDGKAITVFQPPEGLDLIAETRAYFRDAIKHSMRTLKSGRPEKYFLDFDTIAAEPARLERVVDLFTQAIEEAQAENAVEYLVFLDKGSSGYGGATIGAVVLASALSLRTALPYVLVRQDKYSDSEKVKTPRVAPRAQGSLQGLRGAIITDHLSEGQEVLDAIDAIEYFGGRITDCVAYTRRTDLLRRDDFDRKSVQLRCLHDFPETADMLGLSLGCADGLSGKD